MSEFKDEADQTPLLSPEQTQVLNDAVLATLKSQNLMRTCLGIVPSETDKLRGAMVEALFWLDENAPSRASEALKKALNIQ